MDEKQGGAQGPNAGVPEAKPDSSAGKSTESSSQLNQTAASLLEAMMPQLTEQVQNVVQETLARSQQSLKDKRIAKQEGRLGSLEDAVARLSKHLDQGASLEEAKLRTSEEIRQEDLESKLAELEAKVNSENVGSIQESWAETEQRILPSLGLTPNDPIIQKMKADAGSPEAYIKALKEKSWELATRSRGDAGELSPQGQGGLPVTQEDLAAEFERELDQLRTTHPGNDKMVVKLRQKYRAKGLQI